MPKTPLQPTEVERELHEINHIPLRSRCGYCTRGKANGAGRYLVVGFRIRVPVVQVDFADLYAEGWRGPLKSEKGGLRGPLLAGL